MLLLAERAGQLEQGAQPLGDRERLRRVGEVLAEHDELVAAEARERVVDAQAVGQARGEAAEQLVAGLVAQAVVDDLELVEIDEEDGERRAGPLRAGQRVRQAVEEERPVGQPGERVVQRLVAQVVDGALAADGAAEDTGQRPHEPHVLVAEAARDAGVDAQDAERLPADVGHHHGDAGAHAERTQPRRVEARLGVRVLDHDRLGALQRVTGQGVAQGGPDPPALAPARDGHGAQALGLRLELEQRGERDAEPVGRALHRGGEERLEVVAVDGERAEDGEVLLLDGAPVAPGDVLDLEDEVLRAPGGVVDARRAQDQVERLGVRVHAALLALDHRHGAAEEPAHVRVQALVVIGMDALDDRAAGELRGFDAEERRESGIDLEPATVEADYGEADGRVPERALGERGVGGRGDGHQSSIVR